MCILIIDYIILKFNYYWMVVNDKIILCMVRILIIKESLYDKDIYFDFILLDFVFYKI